LDEELKGPQWFDAAKYPAISFVSSKVTPTGRGTARVDGTLTMHGVSKPETLAVKFNGAAVNPIDHSYSVGFEASGSVRRSDFGVKTYVPLVGDDVTLMISGAFEAAK
jgi:polyisoprenoid-binding protein YceI